MKVPKHKRLSTVVLVVAAFGVAATVSANPVKLRCAYRENPLGIDVPAPQLSWQSDNAERNWRQSAYEILVATQSGLLAPGNADMWDSGKQTSAESAAIRVSPIRTPPAPRSSIKVCSRRTPRQPRRNQIPYRPTWDISQ